MNVLFIARKYPPSVGGMETQAHGLISSFSGEKKTILLRRSQAHLVWFVPFALIKGLIMGRDVDVIHLCDGLLAPVGLLLKWILKKPVSVTVHGLDLLYPNWIYQNVNMRSLRHLTSYIAVCRVTKQRMVDRGFSADRITVIPNGVDPHRLPEPGSREEFLKMIPIGVEPHYRFLLTTGRLVRRKGVAWFVSAVVPLLPKEIVYMVAGAGPDDSRIASTIQENGLQDRVKLLGKVSDRALSTLYHHADCFVMPNISVFGDQEGFGLVAIEAAMSGLPVVAADLEGIKDAIHDGQNGFLVQEKDANGFAKTILDVLNHPHPDALRHHIREYSLSRFKWKIRVKEYEAVFKFLIGGRKAL